MLQQGSLVLSPMSVVTQCKIRMGDATKLCTSAASAHSRQKKKTEKKNDQDRIRLFFLSFWECCWINYHHISRSYLLVRKHRGQTYLIFLGYNKFIINCIFGDTRGHSVLPNTNIMFWVSNKGKGRCDKKPTRFLELHLQD